MFRSKKDVERHVLDVLSKIDSENEKNLRGYTFARLFFQVKDYDSTLKYLSGFLSIRDHHAPAHKLMAQIYEATNNPESALQSYKRSLEIDSHQNDIVLKICELYCQLPVDHETAKYWADRAEQIFPHNDIVFKLRECLVSAEGDPDHQELENLIATELQAQPKNIDLRIKLLRLYLDTERVKEAYEHATLIESKMLFPSSDDWYYTLTDIYEAYQEEYKQDLDSGFFIHYLTALDHLVHLTLSEPHTRENQKKTSSLSDTVDILFLFDKYLKKASEQNIKEGSWTYFLHHMKGQLFYHMTAVLLKKAKMDQGNRKEALRLSAGLALICYSIKPLNLLQEMWFSQLSENQKVYTNFFQQGSIRTSFIGHVIQSMCKDDKSKWLQKIKSDVCIFQVKERIFNRIFSSVVHQKNLSASFFMENSAFESSSLEFPSDNTLKEYDISAYKLCASSLHHFVWLELHGKSNHIQGCPLNEIFKGLQYNNKNLSKGSCESLCILDIESYLCATVYQAEAEIEKRKTMFNNWNQELYMSCLPDIADAMCSRQQGEWWRTAYGLHTCTIKEKLGESRRILQQGLEVIRGIGNHGMEIQLVVHLARYFGDKAEFLMKDIENSNNEKKKILPENITALQFRATHYWNVAIGMLEKLMAGGIVKIPKERMFIGYEEPLSKMEIRTLIENGKLYLAVQLMESEKLNEAAEMLSQLTSPYGSFYLALTLKKFASQEEKFSNSRKVFLTKALNSIHETMDRIKDDSGHPLNKEIHIVLEDIENELGTGRSMSNGNTEDSDEVDANDPISSSNDSVYVTPNSFNLNKHSTPKPSSKFMSTKSTLHHSNSNFPKHFEPSPERLDAQIRALTLNQDTVIKAFMEQNKSLLETNKSIAEALLKNNEVLADLKKQLAELKISETKTPLKAPSKKPSFFKGQGDDDYENLDPNSLNIDQNCLLEYYEDHNEDYRAAGPSYNYNPTRMAQEAASLNYVVPPSLPPGPPPSLAHYNFQYPPHAMLPAAPVADRQFYQPPGQSLPFSEGQQLPQFNFRVASPVVRPPAPILSNLSNISHALSPQPPPNIPQPSVLAPPSSSAMSLSSPWSKAAGVPHAFQIPLPPSVPFASTTSLSPQPASSTAAVTTQSTLKTLLSTSYSGSQSFSGSTQSPAEVPTSTPVSLSIFSGASKTPEQKLNERSRCDSDVAGSPEIDGHDIEKEVMGDFKPLIPLPDEIVVETGEEDEVVLFEDRAKLYRFVDQEWKERGLGTVKILYHEGSKRVRLLMRRDQVLKVCANHYITPNMEVKPLKTSDRAWTWVAQDFADNELKPEHFCIRFKTAELAASFKNAFEKAVNIAKDNDIKTVSLNKSSTVTSPSPHKSFGSKFLHKSGSWLCPTCYISNASDKHFCEACETKKPGCTSTPSLVISVVSTAVTKPFIPTSPLVFKLPTSHSESFTFSPPLNTNKSSFEMSGKPDNTSKSVFGGFTFSSSPTIQEIANPDAKEREILVVSTKSKNGPQVTKLNTPKTSPFSGFSFTSPPTTTKPSLFSVSNENDSQSISVGQTKTDSSKVFGGFSFSTTSSTSQSSSVKETSFSNSNIPSDFSFKITAPANFLGLSAQESSTSSNSVPSLSKLQSMVQNVSPTLVFGPKDNQSLVSSPNTNFVKSSDVGETKSFSPITSSRGNSDLAPEDFVPTAEFKPVISLPALVDLKTGEEGGEIKFCEKAKLFRYDSETKEWKERGTGELKILFLKDSQKYRVLMRRDQVLKICANHNVLPEMKLTPLASSDRSWVWCAQDFSEGELVQEKFAAKFKTVEIAKQFFSVFEQCQAELKKTEKLMPQSDPCKGNKDAFEKLFQPTPNLWQCSKCQKYNSNQSSCVYCKTFLDKSTPNSKVPADDKPLSELFKPPVDSWECSSCYVRNNFTDLKCVSCNSAKPGSSKTQEVTSSTKPISELFKPSPGSWECQSCMVRNESDKNKCVSCETAKPGSTVSSEKQTSNTTSKFQFNSISSTNSSTPVFSFGSSGSGFVFGTKPSVEPSTFTFGQTALTKNEQVPGFKPTLPATNAAAVFGSMSQKSTANEQSSISIPPVTAAPTFVFGSAEISSFTFGSLASKNAEEESVGFRFGSPQKYEFNFSGVRPRSPTKTPKSPRSPETPSDVDEDEEVVASDADNIYFTPVIPLPPKVDLKTGEENETTVFCKRAKLYRFFEGEWKERGLGDIKILHDEKNQRIRLLMRREQVLKVCLNHYLTEEIKFEWKGDKSLTWAATDFSENEATPELFAIKFKTAELAQEFKKAVDDALSIKVNKKPQDASSDALKTFSFKMPSSFAQSSQEKPLFGSMGLSENKDTSSSTEQKPQVASDALKNFSFKLNTPVKIESNFSAGTLSTRFGVSTDEKPLFGNFSENKSSLFSFKDTPATGSFFGTQSFGVNNSKSVFGGEGFKFGSFGTKEFAVDPEVEVVYEVKPTTQQIASAEKLKLPKTFYLYENKTSCPGCIGCTDTIPTYKGEVIENEVKEEKFEVPQTKVDTTLPFASTTNTVSFTDLAAGNTIKPFFAQQSDGKTVFAGAGTPLFANLNTSAKSEDDTVPENPDIHFEPIIPLPDLIEIKTGEEDETPLFVHRAKLFRFDASTKQWKERGIGDIKILKHKEKIKFRVILRRDQVHNIACNHCITADMSLSPLATSENAVCWNAIDYSDGQAEGSKFAVRFKTKDVVEQFKQVFNECVEIMKQQSVVSTSDAPVKNESTSVKSDLTPSQLEVVSAFQSQNLQAPITIAAAESTDNEDGNSEELSDEDSLVFERRVTYEIVDDVTQTKNTGMGTLLMNYDDTVFGYHVTIVNDQGEDVCDHVIAIQNCLRSEGKKAFWSAIDISIQPARKRQFIAHFSSLDALNEFQKHFEEGKNFALNSGIVENEENERFAEEE